ncbi:hypothetical protein ACFZA1_42735 [Streptomyces filipinensis]|uniref:hypothetical protein n=1 Tax=Streptomyces filipinensis TaxID=66887 RepID=UPI0036EA7694
MEDLDGIGPGTVGLLGQVVAGMVSQLPVDRGHGPALRSDQGGEQDRALRFRTAGTRGGPAPAQHLHLGLRQLAQALELSVQIGEGNGLAQPGCVLQNVAYDVGQAGLVEVLWA